MDAAILARSGLKSNAESREDASDHSRGGRFRQSLASSRNSPDDLAMRWLVHGNLTQAAVDALVRHEHKAQRAEEIGLAPGAAHEDVLKTAQKQQLDVITASPELASAPFELQLPFKRSIVFLQLEGGDVEQDDAIDRLFARYKRLSPGRLYTVTTSRVKVRQLPGQ
jgi:hypothetical protein